MDKPHNPSAAINHSHAVLNALRAAMSGEAARCLTRELLKLPQELAPQRPLPGLPLEHVERLFSAFSEEETVILVLDQPEATIRPQFQREIDDLQLRARYVKLLLQTLMSGQGSSDRAARELTSFYVGHFRAREAYIHGLIQYAETFSLWDMKRHWESHLENTEDLIEDSRDLLIEVSQTKDLSSYQVQRIYDSCVLIPASLRCQSHDMRHILSLYTGSFTFDDLDDYSLEERNAWINIGLTAEQAGYWKSYEISPEECSEWLQMGFTEPRHAGAWKVRGFDPESAHHWALQGFDASEAYLCRHGGITSPEAADKMRNNYH